MNRKFIAFAALSAAAFAVSSLAGCASTRTESLPVDCCSDRSGRGKVLFSVRWPERSRLIPDASNSIVATLTRGATVVGRRVLARPTSGNDATVTFTDIAVGSVTLTAEAFPTLDGTGVAQSSSATVGVVSQSRVVSITVEMQSTIDRLEISPDPSGLAPGTSAQLSATAFNAAGSLVPISPANLTWASSNNGVASVNSSGNLTVNSVGDATITTIERESGKTGSVVVSPGRVVASYKLDEGSGTSVADTSGDGNTGTLLGLSGSALPQWVSGFNGSGLRFTNGTGYVNIPNRPSLEPNRLTVEAWIRSNGPGGAQYVVAKGVNGCLYASFGMYVANGISFYVTPIGRFATLSPGSGSGIWDGNWHYVVGTYDGAFVRLYVDGAQVGNGTAASGPIEYGLPTFNDLRIGGIAQPGCVYIFNGEIDQVRIWSRPLSEPEIAAIYAGDTGGGGGVAGP